MSKCRISVVVGSGWHSRRDIDERSLRPSTSTGGTGFIRPLLQLSAIPKSRGESGRFFRAGERRRARGLYGTRTTRPARDGQCLILSRYHEWLDGTEGHRKNSGRGIVDFDKDRRILRFLEDNNEYSGRGDVHATFDEASACGQKQRDSRVRDKHCLKHFISSRTKNPGKVKTKSLIQRSTATQRRTRGVQKNAGSGREGERGDDGRDGRKVFRGRQSSGRPSF